MCLVLYRSQAHYKPQTAVNMFFQSILFCDPTDHSTHRSVTKINLVANDNKRKVLGIAWTRLYQKFIAPALQRLERVWNGDVVDEDAAVGAPVERNAETLEPLLSSRVPDLQHSHNKLRTL